jgi:hypothetical protein
VCRDAVCWVGHCRAALKEQKRHVEALGRNIVEVEDSIIAFRGGGGWELGQFDLVLSSGVKFAVNFLQNNSSSAKTFFRDMHHVSCLEEIASWQFDVDLEHLEAIVRQENI